MERAIQRGRLITSCSNRSLRKPTAGLRHSPLQIGQNLWIHLWMTLPNRKRFSFRQSAGNEELMQPRPPLFLSNVGQGFLRRSDSCRRNRASCARSLLAKVGRRFAGRTLRVGWHLVKAPFSQKLLPSRATDWYSERRLRRAYSISLVPKLTRTRTPP